MSGLFWMLVLLAYGWYVRRRGVWRYVLVAVLLLLGLSAKSMLVTLPLILLLLDFWPLRRQNERIPAVMAKIAEWLLNCWPSGRTDESAKLRLLNSGASGGTAESIKLSLSRHLDSAKSDPPRFSPWSIAWLVIEKLPLLAISAGVCVIIVVGQHGAGAMSMSSALPLWVRVANAIESYVLYLWKMIWPFNLAICYPFPEMTPELETRLMWSGIGSAILLAAITVAVIWNLRRRPYLAVGWFWYLGALVPTIGLIRVGIQTMADRYTYLPMIGIYMAIVWGVADLAACGGSFGRLWRSPPACCWPRGWRGPTIRPRLGKTASHCSNTRSTSPPAITSRTIITALPSTTRQTMRMPASSTPKRRSSRHYDSANGNLGVYYAWRSSMEMSRGDGKAAHDYLEKAVAQFRKAAGINPYVSSFNANLGQTCLSLGNFDEAETAYRGAIKAEPNNPMYHGSLSIVLHCRGKGREAIAEHRKMIDLCPNDFTLANEYFKMLQLYPRDELLLSDFAWLLATSPEPRLRNGQKAVEFAQQAVNVSGGTKPAVLGTLAAAYAEQGRFAEAVETANQAADLAMQQHNEPLANAIRAKIEFYKVGTPYRERRSPPPR